MTYIEIATRIWSHNITESLKTGIDRNIGVD